MDALDATLRRLDQERADADKRYNDALTALDRSLPPLPEWPSPAPGVDDSQLASINSQWDIAVTAPSGGGWRGRLAGFIWRTIAPYLQRQASFNAALVDHLNRNAAAARNAHQRAEETAARLREQSAKLLDFHARTLQYLQQITAYVDTRDRRSEGGALIVNAAVSGLAENVDKRWESLAAREQRGEARAGALASGMEDLRAMLGVAQQSSLMLKREVEKLLASPPLTGSTSTTAPAQVPPATDLFRPLDSYKYVGFEDQFRGSRDAIRARLESYLPFFAGASDVLDVGCGRGEFLELLAGAGISASGLDLNHEMVELCRSRGLAVVEADAVGHLSTLEDGALGGLFAAQVVEHLQPGYLLQFLELAFHKVRPGGRVVLETLNPACWVAFFESYIRDITHVWPLHPETLKYLVLASGFTRAEIEYRSPVARQDRLQTIALPHGADGALAELAEAFNANVEKLNSRIFTHLDYAIVAVR